MSTPRTFGRYELRGILGQGGFATVYRAWDPGLEREVALKALRPERVADEQVRRRFLAEARAIARLRHPNIAIVHEVGEVNGRSYFAMELIDGHTLAHFIGPGREMPLPQVVSVLRSLATAIDALHAAGLVHRDIKAANIMIERGGRVVLMDLGIARDLGDSQGTRTGAILGTLETMSPEQVNGEPAGPPADIYALGIVTYQMLAGRPPFQGNTARLLYAHAHELPPPLRQIRPGLSEPVYRAVDAALAKNPARRPASAQEFVAAFMASMTPQGMATPVRTTPTTGIPGSHPSGAETARTRTSSGSRWLIGAGLAVFAVLAVFALVALRVFLGTDSTSNGGGSVAAATGGSSAQAAGGVAPAVSTATATTATAMSTSTVTTPARAMATATSTATATTSPTATPSATPASAAPAQLTAALTAQTAPSRAAKPGQGILRLSFERTDGAMRGRYVEVYATRKDVRGVSVQGDRVAGRDTDNTGFVSFDLPPGEYIVLSDLPGYNWGTFATAKGQPDVAVQAGQETTLAVRLGRLTFTAATVEKALQGRYIEVYLQKQDINGTIVRGDRVAGGDTDNTGRMSFDLVPGPYIVVSDFAGYNWGDLTDGKGRRNIAVEAGNETVQDLRPGRLSVALRTATGAVATNKYVEVYLQRRDANGRTVLGDRVTGGNTDNRGIWQVDLVAGAYALKVDDRTTLNVAVEEGKQTEVAP
jgi:tRNA A-37 threonylcarbamoyl transferase component Bud32